MNGFWRRPNVRRNEVTFRQNHSFSYNARIGRRGYGRIFTATPWLVAVTLIALAWSSMAFCSDIHDAARDGDLTKVKALLKQNPDLVFSKDMYGLTPLHWGAINGHKSVVKLLLAKKADVNAKGDNGMTPLHYATDHDHKDVVELLLAKHANINAKECFGWTSLHYAANHGYKGIAELLLTKGAAVNAVGSKGETPLHRAVGNGHEEVAQLLRQHSGHE